MTFSELTEMANVNRYSLEEVNQIIRLPIHLVTHDEPVYSFRELVTMFLSLPELLVCDNPRSLPPPLVGYDRVRVWLGNRVQQDRGVPVVLWPLVRGRGNDPRTVICDPRMRGGRPTITGIPTYILSEMFVGGASVDRLARAYDIDKDQVEDAVRFESGPLPYLNLPALSGWESQLTGGDQW